MKKTHQISESIRYRMKESSTLHWRQYCVLIEAVILFSVGFMSQGYNLLANSLTSLVCGIQVQSFRKIHGNAMATTMCIGNLRFAMMFLNNQQERCNQKEVENKREG